MLFAVGSADKVLELCRCAALGGQEVVTTHFEAMLAGVADILLISGVNIVAALGCLDIDKLDLGLIPKL